MRKLLYLVFILICFVTKSQDFEANQFLENDTKIVVKREFTDNIKDKYSGKDFEYEEFEPKVKQNFADFSFINMFILVLAKVVPWIIGALLLYLILKAVFDLNFDFFKRKSTSKKGTENLIYEDEEINDTDLNALLKQSLAQPNFRLAIRYYYLLILKGLSSKKMITYHKDKTNADYLIELENKQLKQQFSTLSYIYAYVWYGEFEVDEKSFKKAEKQYQSFLKSLV